MLPVVTIRVVYRSPSWNVIAFELSAHVCCPAPTVHPMLVETQLRGKEPLATQRSMENDAGATTGDCTRKLLATMQRSVRTVLTVSTNGELKLPNTVAGTPISLLRRLVFTCPMPSIVIAMLRCANDEHRMLVHPLVPSMRTVSKSPAST